MQTQITKINELAAEAARGSGLYFELAVERFMPAFNRLLYQAPVADRDELIKAAEATGFYFPAWLD